MSYQFNFRNARESDLTAIRDLVTEVFLASEPTSSHLKISVPGFHIIYDAFVNGVDLNTTVLAEEINSGELAAVLVNAPYHSDDGGSIQEGRPFMQFLHEFYEPLKNRVLIPRKIPESRVLHCALAATRAKYERQRLFSTLLQETMNIVKRDRRYDLVMAEATSPVTRHVFKNVFGWNEEYVIQYPTYEVDGKRPYATLEGEAALVWTELPTERL